MKESIDFANWLYDNRWFSKQNGLWCYTFEMGTVVSETSYRKNYMKTSEELFKMFQEQNKTK